jgi:hypothetical protein
MRRCEKELQVQVQVQVPIGDERFVSGRPVFLAVEEETGQKKKKETNQVRKKGLYFLFHQSPSIFAA